MIAADEEGTVAGLGEFGLIAALSQWLPRDPRALVGIGDDAAVLAAPDGRVVATTDFLLEGRHFRRDWSAAGDVGRKAAARSLADVAAMGAEPTGLLVALAAPPDLPVSWARELAAGLAAECARAGASVIGGDTARASCVLLAVTGLGDLAGLDPVRRSGAAPGDLVAVAGPLGRAAAGLALLSAGLTRLPAAAPLVAAQLRPAPPYPAGPQAARLGATAMIDISDGLLADLGHVADRRGPRGSRCPPSRFLAPNGRWCHGLVRRLAARRGAALGTDRRRGPLPGGHVRSWRGAAGRLDGDRGGTPGPGRAGGRPGVGRAGRLGPLPPAGRAERVR